MIQYFNHDFNVEARVFHGSKDVVVKGLKIMVNKWPDPSGVKAFPEIPEDFCIHLKKSELSALITVLLDCQRSLKNG